MTPPCPKPQSGQIDFSRINATPDQIYRMALDAQRRGDISAKMQYMKRAAELGQINAMTGLGVDYIMGKDIEKDPAKGLKLLEAATARGHAAAEWQLGTAYDNGEVVPYNGPLAARYISAAAAQHYANAETWMGITTELGSNGLTRNRQLAIAYLNRGASDGQDGKPQMMAEFLSRPGTPRFADVDQLFSAFQAAMAKAYSDFYFPGWPSGGHRLNYSNCTGIYASSACAHSAYAGAYERSRGN
jgi:TPR repeat protein